MVPIQHLAQLIEALGLETGEPVLDGQAKRRFAKSVTGEAEQRLGVLQRIGRERRSALIAQGRHLLTQAATTGQLGSARCSTRKHRLSAMPP